MYCVEVPTVVTVKGVTALFAVEVSVAVVCQYQVSPTGAVPAAVMVTPDGAHTGESLVGVDGVAGNASTVKSVNVVAVPLAVVTEIGPVVPVPTVTVTVVAVFAVMVAAVPPIVTADALAKNVPPMIIELPAQALAGKEVMVGVGGDQVNDLPLPGNAPLLTRHEASFKVPDVVPLFQVVFVMRLRLLKSPLVEPLKPT